MTITKVTPNFLEYDPNRQKAKRIFQRMITGLQIASNQNRDMRFLTLTTSNEKRYSRHKVGETSEGKPIWEQKERTLKDSFDILRQRIKRARVNREGFTGFNLNKYYCLRTSEGNGVLHLIFWGGNYIPLTWLKNAWHDIHGAYQVNIQFVHNKKRTVGGLVGYLLDNYLLNQPIKRMSYGWGWAWLGFCKSWEKVRGIYKETGLKRGTQEFNTLRNQYIPSPLRVDTKQAIPFWRGILKQPPKTSRQTKFKYPNRGLNRNFF